MSDHYVAYLQAHLREVTGERDRAVARADRLQAGLDALIARVHPKCTAETCRDVAVLEEVGLR